MKQSISQNFFLNLDLILISCEGRQTGFNIADAPLVVKKILADIILDFFKNSSNVNFHRHESLLIIRFDTRLVHEFINSFFKILYKSRDYSSNLVASSSYIDDLLLGYIFKDVSSNDCVNTFKKLYTEWMPRDLEYFYNKKMISLGSFLFGSRSILDAAMLECKSIKLAPRGLSRQLNFILYSKYYLSSHNDFIVNKITAENSILYTVGGRGDYAGVSKSDNFFQNADDALYFFRIVNSLIIHSGEYDINLILSPDLASNSTLQQFISYFITTVTVYLNVSPIVYGSFEATVFNHYLDNKGLFFSIVYADSIDESIKNDYLLNLMQYCLPKQDGVLDGIKFKNGDSDSYKINFIITAHAHAHAHAEAGMSIRSIWNLIGVIQSADMIGQALITCIIDNGTDATKHAIYAFAEMINFQHISIYEVSFGDLSSARNYAVSISRSEFISIHDADDFVSLNWLSTLVDESDFFSNKGLIFHPKVNIFFGDGERVMWSPCMVDDVNSIEWANLLVDNFWTSCSAGHISIYKNFPYELIDKKLGVGFEDWSWNVKTIEKNYIHRAIPETSLFVRLKPTIDSLNKQSATHALIPKFSNSQIDMIMYKAGLLELAP